MALILSVGMRKAAPEPELAGTAVAAPMTAGPEFVKEFGAVAEG